MPNLIEYATYARGKSTTCIAVSAGLIAAFLGVAPNVGLAVEQRYPFKWNSALWDSPRPSPLPAGYEDGNGFHRKLAHFPEGGLGLQFVDVFLPAGMQPLVIKREYRSGLRTAGVFGVGWASNLDVRLANAPAETPRIVESDGRATGYELQSSGRYAPIAGSFPRSILQRWDDKWIRDWNDGLREIFDASGRLEQRVTENDTLKFSYLDSTSRWPSAVTDAAGHTATLLYRDGLLVQVNYPSNRTVKYEYVGRSLTKVTDSIGRKTSFVYADGKMSEMTLPGGQKLAFTYGPDGTLSEASGPLTLRTTFAWWTDPDTATVTLTATSATGAVYMLQAGAAEIDVADWGIGDKGKQIALQLRNVMPGGERSSAFLVADKILLSSLAGRTVLDPAAKSEPNTSATPPDDVHSWRARFTPAMAPMRDPKVTYDSAGRAVGLVLEPQLLESWKWDDADRIMEWTDAEGSVARYGYDGMNRLVRITIDDRLFGFAEYNEIGLLSRVVNAQGRASRYIYDAGGNLERFTDEGGHVTNYSNDANGRPIEMQIDGNLAMRFSYDAAGRLASISDGNNSTTRYRYDERGKPLEEIDEKGRMTSYRYDEQGRSVGISYPDGREVVVTYLQDGRKVVIKDATGAQTTREYDQAGQLRGAQLPGIPEFKFTYDKAGRLLIAARSNGESRKFNYDADGRLLSELNAKGEGVRYDYDREGRLAGYDSGREKSAFKYDDQGGIAIAMRRGNESSELRYDVKGRLLGYRDASSAQRNYIYDSTIFRGVAGPEGDMLRYLYNEKGRIAILRHEFNGKTASKQYKYNDSGRIAEVTHEDGTVEQFRYDSTGRLASKRDRIGNTYSYAYAAGGRMESIAGPYGVERWKYDAQNRMIEHEDPTEGVFRFEYSDRADQVTVINPGGGRTRVTANADGEPVVVEDALGGTIKSDYDNAGRLVAYTDPNENRTTWTYDSRGRVTERRSPVGKVYRYKYNSDGKLLETQSPGNTVVKREYDSLGRLAKLSGSDGQAWAYAYDKQNRVTTIEGRTGRATYSYDVLDRVTDYRDPTGAAVHIDYDVAGRPQTVMTPRSGKLIYSYDSMGRLGAIATPNGQIKYTYDSAGRIAAIDYPNNTRTAYRYVAGARIQSITTTGAQGKVLLSEEYEYDSRGNVTGITKRGEVAGSVEAQNAFKRTLGRSEFRYDALNRVVDATFPDDAREQFTYDRAGNLTNHVKQIAKADGTKSEIVTPYAYDADQALTKNGTVDVPPDPNGNLCVERTGTGCAVTYDAFNRLSVWRDQRYEYDSENRLLGWRDRKGNSVSYLYLGEQVLAEMGSSARVYVPGVHPSSWSALRVGEQQFFPIRSANGSLLALTDKNGVIVQTCSYRTFSIGSAWSASGVKADCEYAGGRQIGPGFWFGSRVLSSIGARFMTRDANGPDKDGNFYSYAFANPLRFTDISGTNGRSLSSGLPDGRIVPFRPQGLIDRGVTPYVAKPWDGTEKSAVDALRDIALTDPNPVTRKIAADGMTQYAGANVSVQDVFVKGGNSYETVSGAQRGSNVTLYERGVAYGTREFGGDATQLAASSLKHELEHTTQPAAPTKVGEWEARQSDYFIKKAGGQSFDSPLIGTTPEAPSRLEKIDTLKAYKNLPEGVPNPNPTYTETVRTMQIDPAAPEVGGIPNYTERVIQQEQKTVVTSVQERAADDLKQQIARGREITVAGEETTITQGGRVIVDSKGNLTYIDSAGDIHFQNPVTGEMYDAPAGTVLPEAEKLNISSNVDRLREASVSQAAVEKAAVKAERAAIASSSEINASGGTVSRAVAREATVTEKIVEKTGAVKKAVENAIDKVLTKNSAVLDKVGAVAERAFRYIADSRIGRFVKNTVPVVGQILMIKDAIDTAVSLGQTAGEVAADLYLHVKKGRDAILNPLEDLARRIAALEDATDQTRRQRDARRNELLARSAPETLQLHDGPPGTPQHTAATTPYTPDSSSASPSGQPSAPAGSSAGIPPPTTPLGGQANQPPAGPQNRLAGQPSNDPGRPPSQRDPTGPPPQQRDPDNRPPSGTAPPSRDAGATSPQDGIDLAGLCGTNVRQITERMMAGRISAEQANDCWCYLWRKAGSNPTIKLDKGQPATQFCAQRVAKAPALAPAEAQSPAPQPNPPKPQATNPQPETPKQSATQPSSTPEREGLPPPSFPNPRDAVEQAKEPTKPKGPSLRDLMTKEELEAYTTEMSKRPDLEKPNLYDPKSKNPEGGITPKVTSSSNQPQSSGSTGGGLLGAWDRATQRIGSGVTDKVR